MGARLYLSKWYTYQKERFPFAQYIPMIGAFSFCAVSYSSILRSSSIRLEAFLAAFITSLTFFMLLRIADEFKDYEEDVKYRSYRPVPRGLVKLRELAVIGIFLAIMQFTVAYVYYPPLIMLLFAVWIYFALMSCEFFLHQFLISRPVIYLLSHMLIMPLIDFYAAACDFLPYIDIERAFPHFIWFMLASFLNGIVIEIGRKIRAKEDEEEGVQTYTALWGNKKAIFSWLVSMGISFVTATFAAFKINNSIPVGMMLSVFYLTSVVFSIKFLQAPVSQHAKIIEKLSGLWTILMYVSLGVLPIVR